MEESLGPGSLLPGSPDYNKARKQYLRSNRHRPPEDTSKWTAFRTSEKKFMTRYPSPDLSEVLDLALLDAERQTEVDMGKWKGATDAVRTREIELKKDVPDRRRRRAFCVPQIPGLVILPGYLCHETQRQLVRWSLTEHARHPNETNLDAHYDIPKEGLWDVHVRSDKRVIPLRRNDSTIFANSPAKDQQQRESLSQTNLPPKLSPRSGLATTSELITKLRWANIGWFYNWGSKKYEFNRGKIEVGEPVRSICKEVVRSIDWTNVFVGASSSSEEQSRWSETGPDWESWDMTYEPDAGIVNFYQYKDTLMGHVDRAEVCATSPLVSLSLGNAAVFLIGGPTRDQEPVAILLRSGDAIVMAGPACRRVYHGVPRVLEGTLPERLDIRSCPGSDWAIYSRYLQSTRINVNVRQVFPKGFDPSQ
ncbi:uncharacterized protein FOMMEDRAFT_145266 [Fomitiporia mediterranea MF3/22]|uniref:uncharacterized protein n=1 Tax=Fomitiporia mediterranea (strain MF3/22) TaxID=694068 RepID=UPI0004407EBF|nr:uncharacterized protein FOMMEDRAFT_145266 [Fomitiporia mediterranea MF3/22]EJD05912.1 hypothetical protein FOMMEDRAFT_145266 [Fomitiporia mediterranea MF3/22]